MVITKELIQAYVDDAGQWSEAMRKSEVSRLRSVQPDVNGDPKRLWKRLEGRGLAPYTRVTVWTRVCMFWDYLMKAGVVPAGVNPYREFRAKNARFFRNQYVRKVPNVTLAEARRRIDQIHDADIKAKATELLAAGLRWSESFTLKDGEVTGKGGHRRAVFLSGAGVGQGYEGSYTRFWRALRKVGLKPHDLRKVFAGAAADAGATPEELCALLGWKSYDTARSYLAARPEKLKKLAERIQNDPQE